MRQRSHRADLLDIRGAPTAAHAVEAERYAREAEEHRAASQALREAEAAACVGIDPSDRDASPFVHVEDIESVRSLVETRVAGRSQIEEETGAVVRFRAVSGLTSEWLQRVVDCHLARSAALGHDVAGMPNCPLVPKGATAVVSSTGNGFAVAIRGDDEEAIDEIILRASRLIGSGP